MKDAYYFSHDSNARNDQRLIKVRMKYGMEGYGVYFGIIEIMREQEDYIIADSDIESVAYDLRSEKDMVQDILYNHRLFEIRRDIDKEEAYFFSKSLKRRMECLDEKKKNKYAICTAEIGKKSKHGTKRSKWTKEEEERYKACKKGIEESEDLDEMSAMGAGAVAGPGTAKKKKKSLIREEDPTIDEIMNYLFNDLGVIANAN